MPKNLVIAEILSIATMVFIIFALIFDPSITGNLIGTAGEIQRADISPNAQNDYWYGLYGNVSEIYVTTDITISGGNHILQENLGLKKCVGAEIYATENPTINWAGLVPATPNDVNLYLGITNASTYAGTRIFTEQTTFNISNTSMLLYSTKTKSPAGDIDMGILLDGADLVYVTKTNDNTEAFNSVLVDYQFMLPTLGVSTDYNFFLDSADLIRCNDPPFFVSVTTPGIITQGTDVQIILRYDDPNDDPLILSSSITPNSINYVSSEQAIINWTPTAFEVGDLNITFTISDAYGNIATQIKEVYVENLNDAPIILEISDIDTYVNEPYIQYIKVFDADSNNSGTNETVEFTINPYISWLDIDSYYNSSDNNYYGIINFTAYNSQKGTLNINVTVTDGLASDSQVIELKIGYCGDFDSSDNSVCDSRYENCGNCVADCGYCTFGLEDSLTIDIINRSCSNSLNIKVMDMAKRATCEDMGIIINKEETCGVVSDAQLKIYELNKFSWELYNEFSTDQLGYAVIPINTEKAYKIVASKSKYNDANRIVGRLFCNNYSIYTINETKQENINSGYENETEILPVIDKPTTITKLKPINTKKIFYFYTFVFLSISIFIGYIHHSHKIHSKNMGDRINLSNLENNSPKAREILELKNAINAEKTKQRFRRKAILKAKFRKFKRRFMEFIGY